MSAPEFTQEQIENWKAFDAIRGTAIMNMLDSRQGAELSGMTRDEWKFTMTNYAPLKAQAEQEKANAN